MIEPQTHWEYAMELMPTEIGATNGTPGAHLVTDVPTLTMDLKPFLKLKIGMIFWNSKNSNEGILLNLFIFHLNRNIRDFVLERKDQIKFFNTIHSYSQLGGFQLEFASISRVINHMTCYNSSALIGWNYSIQTGEKILQRIFL